MEMVDFAWQTPICFTAPDGSNWHNVMVTLLISAHILLKLKCEWPTFKSLWYFRVLKTNQMMVLYAHASAIEPCFGSATDNVHLPSDDNEYSEKINITWLSKLQSKDDIHLIFWRKWIRLGVYSFFCSSHERIQDTKTRRTEVQRKGAFQKNFQIQPC